MHYYSLNWILDDMIFRIELRLDLTSIGLLDKLNIPKVMSS
jgi:hypothetical protein